MSTGRFPESSNIDEFKQKLFDGVDCVTANDKRWPKGFLGLPERTGNLLNIDKFDAAFFSINPKQANFMDPQSRILLEVTYECIVDAGYNPAEIRGSNIGVFIGVSHSESHDLWTQDVDTVNGKIL